MDFLQTLNPYRFRPFAPRKTAYTTNAIYPQNKYCRRPSLCIILPWANWRTVLGLQLSPLEERKIIIYQNFLSNLMNVFIKHEIPFESLMVYELLFVE